MQFLANENFPLDVVEALRNEGHDVAWIRTDAPGSKDPWLLHSSCRISSRAHCTGTAVKVRCPTPRRDGKQATGRL